MNAWRTKFQKIQQYLCKSRKILLLTAILVATTLIFSALIAVWLTRSNDKPYDATVANLGTIGTTGIEAFGGDIKSINGIPSIDWGTIQLGETKNVSFFCEVRAMFQRN